MAAFLGRPGSIVVLDTSALMEGVFFADFDWHRLDASLKDEPVCLVVPSLVTEELDALECHRDGRQRAQAGNVLTAPWDLHRARPRRRRRSRIIRR
jgi:rRNA-processing protein FCF1